MNQAELINAIAESTGQSKKAVGDVLTALGHAAGTELAGRLGEVTLPGLGKLKGERRAGRMGRNPATGEAMEIPPKSIVKFVPAKALKDALNP